MTAKKKNAKATTTTKSKTEPQSKNARIVAGKVKPAKKLSQIGAAVEVLRNAGEPMTCKAMVEAMTSTKLWASPGGKTPEATLYAAIVREINARGKEARFVKSAPGQFAARA
jgi:hypothetical protein